MCVIYILNYLSSLSVLHNKRFFIDDRPTVCAVFAGHDHDVRQSTRFVFCFVAVFFLFSLLLLSLVLVCCFITSMKNMIYIVHRVAA